jgi:uncharacterized protein (TIGR01777 family)
MRILITGITGLIGQALKAHLEDTGFEVIGWSHSLSDPESHIYHWIPGQNIVPEDSLIEPINAVIILSGLNVAKYRWTSSVKERLRSSRIESAQCIGTLISSGQIDPSMIMTSIGSAYYGERGLEILDEESSLGRGFLAELGNEIESYWTALLSNLPPDRNPIYHAKLRLGFVLDNQDRTSGFARLARIFNWGMGTILGDGEQYLSWITLEDCCRAIEFVLKQDIPIKNTYSTAINLTAPEPITQRQFAEKLARKLNRPLLFRAPEWALKLLIGEMAQEILLDSQRTVPGYLTKRGFKFKGGNFDEALDLLLGGK